MGWLVGRQVLTASAVFNLAGELKDRHSFQKTAVIGAVINGAESIGGTLAQSYLSGPGIRLRSFHRWALNNYQDIGVPGSVKLTLKQALPSHIRPEVQAIRPGSTVKILGIQMSGANHGFWAEQVILSDFISQINTLWKSEIDRDTNLITITFGDGTTHQFTPVNFVHGSQYIYASYSYSDGNSYLRSGLYIYRIGSGNSTLDALYEVESNSSDAYLAPIPVRLDGEFLSDTNRPAMFSLANRASKKAFRTPLSEVIEQVSESEAVDDMDYVYLVFGAAANSKEQAARAYIYRFLADLAATETASESEYEEWKGVVVGHADDYDQWLLTYEEAPPEEGVVPPPVENPVSPPDGPPSRPWKGIKIENPGGDTNYDVRISWSSISVKTGTGLVSPEAVVGEYWFSVADPDLIKVNAYLPEVPTDLDEVETIWLYHQVSAAQWRAIKIVGMVQQTYVFGNNYEELKLGSQIAQIGDDPERESSFLFPIRYSVLEEMNLKDATQFATSCSYLQVHSYEIHIQRIYQTPLFSFLLFVVVIGITVATGGLGAASVGILGTNAAVGAALGLTGTLAVIAGATLNALAAMVLTSLIAKGATELFGEKFGAIVGVFVSIIAINGLSNLAANGSFALNFSSLSMAETILMATTSVSRAVSGYLNAEIEELAEQSELFLEEYKDEMQKVSEAYAENIGYGTGVIDPLQFLDSTQEFSEAPREFLTRTLMTGSDIAEMTLLMVSNFSDISLDKNNLA